MQYYVAWEEEQESGDERRTESSTALQAELDSTAGAALIPHRLEASSLTTAPAISGINTGGSTKDPVDQPLAERKRNDKEDHAAKMKAARLVAKQSPMEVAKKWLSGLVMDLSNARKAHGDVGTVTDMDEGLRKEYTNQFAYHLKSILKLRENIELLASGPRRGGWHHIEVSRVSGATVPVRLGSTAQGQGGVPRQEQGHWPQAQLSRADGGHLI
jgi:hypothetical protein